MFRPIRDAAVRLRGIEKAVQNNGPAGIETALKWGRYGDLFTYDADSDRLSLHEPISVEDGGHDVHRKRSAGPVSFRLLPWNALPVTGPSLLRHAPIILAGVVSHCSAEGLRGPCDRAVV